MTMVVYSSLVELWQHRDLTWSFAVRDIKAHYKQTALGAAWAVLQPLSLMVVFTLVFSRLARVSTGGIPYPVFAYTGLIFWTFFATTVSQGTIAIVANAALVRKIYFPRETLLISIVLSALLDLAVAGVLFVAMLTYYDVTVSTTVLWVPVLLALQTLFGFAVICLTSAIHVAFRDVGHALPLALQLAMFATPVAYPLSLVPDRLLPLYLLNPMATIIEGYRGAIFAGVPPHTGQLSIAAATIFALLMVGYTIFKRAEKTFADII